jgi:PST family polysaccharide transporter
MIATSDSIVRIVLGPQWAGTTKIFVLLGITGLFQPIANTTGWLLISQGRTNHMLQWGFISGPLTMGSIIAGLPWGAVGVAASYAFTRVCIVDPLLYWFVGRRGPVRTIDFYKTIAPFVLASIVALLAAIEFRRWMNLNSNLMNIVTCGIVVAVTTFLMLAILPTGRKALYDVKNSAPLLLGSKGRASIQSST